MLDRKKVLVIGDLIIDEYIETEAVGLDKAELTTVAYPEFN